MRAVHHLQEESGDGTNTGKTSAHVDSQGVGSTSVGSRRHWGARGV